MEKHFTLRDWSTPPESVLVTGGASVPEQGWGVFSRTGGFASPDMTELCSVHSEEADAQSRTDYLNSTEGYTHYEISGDPDSNVLNSLSFFTGEVALQGARAATLIELTYEQVNNQ